MTFIDEYNSPRLVNRVQRVSLSTSNHSTSLTPISLVQPNKQTVIQADQRQLSTRPQASRCAMTFQRRQGCSYGTACKYDHVCIKPQCLGDHPQWKHTTTHYPPILNTHSPAELFLNPLLEPLAGDIALTASPIAGNYPYVSLETSECVTDFSQSAGLLCFNAQAAQCSLYFHRLKV